MSKIVWGRKKMSTNFEMSREDVIRVARRSLDKYRVEYNLAVFLEDDVTPLTVQFREMYEIATLLQDKLEDGAQNANITPD